MANARKTHERTERNYSNQARRDIHPDYYEEQKPADDNPNAKDPNWKPPVKLASVTPKDYASEIAAGKEDVPTPPDSEKPTMYVKK